MVDEPDNLVLQLLRDVRSAQAEHSILLQRTDLRLNEIERQLKSVNTKITYTLGLATDADFKAQGSMDGSDDLSRRLGEVIARLEALEAR